MKKKIFNKIRLKNTNNLIQLKSSDIQPLRVKMHKAQNGICPILRQKFSVDEMALDHKHSTAASTIGKNGDGLVRGVIHRMANVIEGKFTNAFRRYGLHRYISMPEFLENLAAYLAQKPTNYIHPKEIRKPKKLKKTSFNQLVKVMRLNGEKRLPTYPKSGKVTVPLQKLFLKYNIKPELYA